MMTECVNCAMCVCVCVCVCVCLFPRRTRVRRVPGREVAGLHVACVGCSGLTARRWGNAYPYGRTCVLDWDGAQYCGRSFWLPRRSLARVRMTWTRSNSCVHAMCVCVCVLRACTTRW